MFFAEHPDLALNDTNSNKVRCMSAVKMMKRMHYRIFKNVFRFRARRSAEKFMNTVADVNEEDQLNTTHRLSIDRRRPDSREFRVGWRLTRSIAEDFHWGRQEVSIYNSQIILMCLHVKDWKETLRTTLTIAKWLQAIETTKLFPQDSCRVIKAYIQPIPNSMSWKQSILLSPQPNWVETDNKQVFQDVANITEIYIPYTDNHNHQRVKVAK